MAFETAINENASRRVLNPRVLVQMPVHGIWTNQHTGETIELDGMTENVGTNSLLVNFDNLPPVGGQVNLTIKDDGNELMTVETKVIRVERDPGKPLAALNVLEHTDEWQERVFTAAQEVAIRTYAHDEDEWIN